MIIEDFVNNFLAVILLVNLFIKDVSPNDHLVKYAIVHGTWLFGVLKLYLHHSFDLIEDAAVWRHWEEIVLIEVFVPFYKLFLLFHFIQKM